MSSPDLYPNESPERQASLKILSQEVENSSALVPIKTEMGSLLTQESDANLVTVSMFYFVIGNRVQSDRLDCINSPIIMKSVRDKRIKWHLNINNKMENNKRTVKKQKVGLKMKDGAEEKTTQRVERSVRFSHDLTRKNKDNPSQFTQMAPRQHSTIKQSLHPNPKLPPQTPQITPLSSPQNSLKLFLLTLQDIDSLALKLQALRQNMNKPHGQIYTIPQLYTLIQQYELIFDRAYSERIRYYVVAGLWDQGVVQVGGKDQWERLIGEGLGKGEGDGLTTELVMVVQQFEEQFHREQLTLKYLQQLQQPIQQIIYNLFQQLDTTKTGTIPHTTLPNKHSTQYNTPNINTNISPKFNQNKLTNNIHSYNKHTNTITHGSGQQAGQAGRMRVENLMELVDRVRGQDGDWACQSYRAVGHVMGQFGRLGEIVAERNKVRELDGLNESNQELGLKAKMQHIRQAASQIIQQGKNKSTRYPHPQNSQHSTLQTHRNKPTYSPNNPPTHRQQPPPQPDPYIRPFSTLPERTVLQDRRRMEELRRYQFWEDCRRYDQLLRERICNQIQVVRMEKLRNRLRYYDIL